MSNSKVNAPQNDIVIEMMKQLPIEKIHHREVFFKTASWARWNLRVQRKQKILFLIKLDAAAKKGIRKYCIALTFVRVMHDSSQRKGKGT